ncbi:MAG: ankyrin repeat domain-containing protein, partial [Woeseiaceae bacterium]
MTETTGETAFGAVLRGACLALLMSVLQTGSAVAAADLSLVHAAKAQDWSEVRALLESTGTDVNVAQADGATALAWSVYWNDVDTVKQLLEAGANANAANEYGVAPLHLACQNRSVDVVQALLAGGADPNSALWSGVTPLMIAAKSGREDIVRALISAGADVNTVEPRRGQSALMWAISFANPEAARALIEAGADISARTTKLNEDYSPMELEAYTKSVPGSAQGGYTPLMFAARQGDLASARLLLDRGADVNAESVADGSPLVIATAAGHEDLALILLDVGADHASTDAGGMTALHYAMRDGLKVLHGYNISEGAVVCNFGGDPTRCKPLAVLSQDELDFLNSPMTDLILD